MARKTDKESPKWAARDGQRLRRWRGRHSLSQFQVAAALGVTASRVSELERGVSSGGRKTGPSPDLALRLAELRRSRELTRKAREARK